MKIVVDINGSNTGDQIGGDVVVTALSRWVRAGAYLDIRGAGSHGGIWRTRVDDLDGINARIGPRWKGPCLTLLLHTRPERKP